LNNQWFIILKNDRKTRRELNEATRIRWNQSTGQKELSTSQTVEGSTGYSTDWTNTATHGDSNEKTDLNLKNKNSPLLFLSFLSILKIVLPMSPFRPISSTITNTKIRKTKNMNPRNELLLSSILSTLAPQIYPVTFKAV
jgi:hypothetical protein